MKLFESFQDNEEQLVSTSIEKLVNNDLKLSEKIRTLQDSIEIVKSSNNGKNELILLLFSKFNGDIYFPRKGDNSERFDAIISLSNYNIVTEVEIPSSQILDAPRNLLDDYAVLHTRRKLTNIVPLVICWDLPNKRTDYWNVIEDINKVLGIKIKTISILSLALHYWTNTPIDFMNDDFYLDRHNLTLKKSIDVLNENELNEDDYIGYFTPFK